MSSYLVITYDVSEPKRYAEYNPAGMPAIMASLAKHGGEAVFAGPPDVITGSVGSTTACIRFPDTDAAKAWLADDDYSPLKAIRMESTVNICEYISPGLG